MTYTKPEGITFTEMAIWIDNNVYTDGYDVEVLYRYLYFLSEMIARQGAYFNSAKEYDEYALFCASTLYLRLTNKKQFEYDSSGNPKLERIKSILNYLKKVSYPYKIDYEKTIACTCDEIDKVNIDSIDLIADFNEQLSLYDDKSFQYISSNIIGNVRSHLKNIPFKKNSVEWQNIYISCLLTLLSSVSPTKEQQKRINNCSERRNLTVTRVYTELRYEDPILFHLPENMKNYIRILVNEIRHVIAADISWESDYQINAAESMKVIIKERIDEY